MRRMCRGLEFDICEMAFTTYVCARACGKPFTAIPVFVTRNFHHWAIFYQREVRHPDAEGPGGPQGRRQPRLHRHHRAVGARHPAKRVRRRPEQDHLDADRRRARGWNSRPAERRLPVPRQADARPAAVRRDRRRARRGRRRGARRSSRSSPTPAKPRFDYFRKTGIYPINHGVVVKNSRAQGHARGSPDELIRAFEAAKADLSEGPAGQRQHVVLGQGRGRQRRGGRRPVPVRHREQPQGAGGDHAIRGRPEDGAAEILGRGAVRR